MVNLLNINKAEEEQKILLEELTDSVIGDLMPGMEIILGHRGHFWLHSIFSGLDGQYILPLLTRSDYSSDMARIYESLYLEDRRSEMYGSKSLPPPEGGATNPVFVLEGDGEARVDTPIKVPGLLGIPEMRTRRNSTASRASARSFTSRKEIKDDKVALKTALRESSALGEVRIGMGR